MVLETTICEDLEGLFTRLPGEKTSEWLLNIAFTLFITVPGKISLYVCCGPFMCCCMGIDKCFPPIEVPVPEYPPGV